jgi:hypothetical protein
VIGQVVHDTASRAIQSGTADGVPYHSTAWRAGLGISR